MFIAQASRNVIRESTHSVIALECCPPHDFSVIDEIAVMSFGMWLRAVRQAAGMTQEDLALACGFNGQSRIANYESPTGGREPSIADINTICRVLSVPAGVLVDPVEFSQWQEQPAKLRHGVAVVAYRYIHADEAGRKMIAAIAEAACAEYPHQKASAA